MYILKTFLNESCLSSTTSASARFARRFLKTQLSAFSAGSE